MMKENELSHVEPQGDVDCNRGGRMPPVNFIYRLLKRVLRIEHHNVRVAKKILVEFDIVYLVDVELAALVNTNDCRFL